MLYASIDVQFFVRYYPLRCERVPCISPLVVVMHGRFVHCYLQEAAPYTQYFEIHICQMAYIFCLVLLNVTPHAN